MNRPGYRRSSGYWAANAVTTHRKGHQAVVSRQGIARDSARGGVWRCRCVPARAMNSRDNVVG